MQYLYGVQICSTNPPASVSGTANTVEACSSLKKELDDLLTDIPE